MKASVYGVPDQQGQAKALIQLQFGASEWITSLLKAGRGLFLLEERHDSEAIPWLAVKPLSVAL